MNKEPTYYDGTKLLSMKDINNETPEIYICTSNRSAGKTTYFARKLVNGFMKSGKKFMLIYRYKYELDSVEDKFFKDIQSLFFSQYSMRSESRARGMFRELYFGPSPDPELDGEDEKTFGESCGYAVALNSADNIKKYSHFFSDVDCMMFDEFQSETNTYCSQEIRKLLSIHTSVARGHGKQVRYVPLYMISNPVSILNPYYVELGITSRLKKETKFLKGEGFVLEQGFNESASNAQKESAFNRAFSKNSYVAYASQSIYLNDNVAFIEKMSGKFRYLATLKYNGRYYALKEFFEQGVIYCDDKGDQSFFRKIAITTEDHDINYLTLKANELLISTLRYYFDRGCFRFKNITCKDVVLTALSY